MSPQKVPKQIISLEEYALLVDAVQDYALFGLAPDGTIRTWNSGARRILGYEEQEVLGRHFSIFYGKGDLDAQKPEIELQTAAVHDRVEDEGWRVRKDGSKFWANTIITALHEPDGTLHGFAKVTRDLTEKKLAEERLRQSEETFRLLVSSVRDYAIFMLDPTGHVMSWNEGAAAIKGYKPDEIIGKHLSVFYPPEAAQARKPQHLLETARSEGRVQDEGWRVRKDGTRFWALVTITAVRDERGELRGFAKVTRDLTDRKNAEEMEQRLREQREASRKAEAERRIAEAAAAAAEDANRAKDEFLMTLSHELRTPLTAILGWARLLPAIAPAEGEVREGLHAIERSAELQTRLVDDVLDISRIVSNKLQLHPGAVDVSSAINESIDQIRDLAAEKSQQLIVDVPDDLGIARLDRERFGQILSGLLSNSVKFTPEKGTVRLLARRSEDNLEIEVEDDGEGIDPNFLPHVFDPFRQEDMGANRVHGGLGLGLAIASHLAMAHGGHLVAESRGSGKGSTFRLTLPIVAAEDRVRTNERRGDQILGGKLQGFRILLIDDNPGNRKLISRLLRETGAEVETVDSVESGLRASDQKDPDLVVTDIAMPYQSGYDFLQKVRRRSGGKHLPIVAVSSFDNPGSVEDDDFDDFLRKPIDPFELVDRIERILKKSG